jgi:signal transduction histidine kinase
MFNTLRSKLIFSSCAVAFLCLLLAVGGTLAFAGDYVQKSSFKALEEKRALATPLLRIWLSSSRAQNPARSALLAGIMNEIRASDLRVLLVDPSTLQIIEDTSAKYSAVGQSFRFDVDGSALEQGLASGPGVAGLKQFAGEPDKIEYIAQRIRLLRQPNSIGGQGGAGTDTGPIFQYIVVFAQPQVHLVSNILGDLRGVLLPALVIALVISLAVAYLLARSISRPVTKLADAAAAMARGDYNQRIPVEGRDELSSLTQQFNEMASEVSRARKMQRDFVANVSHDLKTPLTSIQGFSQAILDGTITDRRGYAQAAQIINTEAQRMSRLVSELLSLSRLENGLSSLELQPTDVGQVVSQLVTAMQPQARAAGVHLRVRLSAAPAEEEGRRPVLADVDRLKQAFGNLIDNALKHTPHDGSVTIVVDSMPEGVQILVCDTGHGIPAEDLPRIMERFYQIDKARSSGSRSLGLGLAIAREIVQAHKGQISIDSTVGSGTTVRIFLPADPRTADAQPTGMKRLLRGRQATQPLVAVPPQETHPAGTVTLNGQGPVPTGSNGSRLLP